MSSESPARRSLLDRLYNSWLDRLEWGLLVVLLAAVIGISFTEILNRNFVWHLWDSAAANKVVYVLTFYVGLFGAVLATRSAKHIRIDAISPYLSPRARTRLELLASVAGAVATVWMTAVAYRYIRDFVPVSERFLPDKPEWYWRLRYWRAPMVFAFGLMGVHFAVGAVHRAKELMRPESTEEAA